MFNQITSDSSRMTQRVDLDTDGVLEYKGTVPDLVVGVTW